MLTCDFNKIAKQLRVFSCKFAAYFQNTLPKGTPLGGCFCLYCITYIIIYKIGVLKNLANLFLIKLHASGLQFY